jgi:inorganic pyrophosphatase
LPDSVPSHRYVPDARRGRRRRQGALRPASDHRRDHIRDISDVRDDLLLEIEHFFSVYKDLEPGKSVEGSTWTGVDDAEAEVRARFVRAEERHR